MIQIFGCLTDPHIMSVARHLESGGHDYRILDIYDSASTGFAKQITPKLELSLATSYEESWCPRAIWWRIKPQFLVATGSVADYYDQQFSLKEWLATLAYIPLLHTDCFWVNSRKSDLLASNKVYQLEAASRLGFVVPRTLFTNNPASALSFVRSLGYKSCVHKTLTPYICPDSRQKYTTFIDANTIEMCAAELACCPSIFQEHIKPKYELRLTVVGNQIFSVKVTKKKSSEPDWRTEIFEDIYAPYELSDAFQKKLLRLHDEFGLRFATYDFIVTEAEDLVFLEVNPAGQWLWLEDKLDLPVCAAMAQYLVRCCSAETVRESDC